VFDRRVAARGRDRSSWLDTIRARSRHAAMTQQLSDTFEHLFESFDCSA